MDNILTMMETTSFGITRTCVNCGGQFIAKSSKQVRCKRDCKSSATRNKRRTESRVDNQKTFIGVDGEGVTRPNGDHIYDMLSVGSETLVSSGGAQLDYKEIFTFLYDQYLQNPDATFVGFFLGYDFNQWFRSLPESRARVLLTKEGREARKRKKHSYLGPFVVDDGEWEFDILGMKRFKLRPIGSKGWMYINDTGPFFQTSFLNVINPAQWDEPIVTQEEYAIILEGKQDRGRRMTLAQQLNERSKTARYNTLENEILARVMTHLNAGFTRIDVKLSKDQWYGPGQAAQRWMSLEGIPSTQDVIEVIPDYAWDAAQHSYYGGWFEIFAHGHIPGPTYEYDINSAYPYVISTLPCLLHGEWSKGIGKPTFTGGNNYTLVYATVNGSDPICGTMLHRNSKKRIFRPHLTQGWFWLHELQMAQRAGLIDDIVWQEWVNYSACDCPSPYAKNMPELYKQRLIVGKNSPEGKAYKLIYNSTYGKHAQSIGSPRFANSVYASLITAGCRTMILHAIATHPSKTQSLLMIATDGIYFREPHPSLEISPSTLGKWDAEIKSNITLFMPGLYWDDSTRQRLIEGKSPKLKSRGISAIDLAARVTRLDIAFSAMRNSGEWPTVDIPINFQMITAIQSLMRGKWELAGTLVDGDVKTITANPHTKRVDDPYLCGDIIRTPVYASDDVITSLPYDKTFGKESEEDDLGVGPDGNLSKILYEMVVPE